jgi:hypothetical protein
LIASGGKKSDIPARIKLDDLDWPFQPDALFGLYDEWARH